MTIPNPKTLQRNLPPDGRLRETMNGMESTVGPGIYPGRSAVAAPVVTTKKFHTTFSDGCLGSHIDEERSEMRYVMRIAESSESSRL